jgi:hypothetical protein
MPRAKGKSSGYRPRKVNTREIRQRFLIVCEGKKTEPNYFKSFRVSKYVAIQAEGLAKSPCGLVDWAKKFPEREDYDQIWCVFDRDSWTEVDFSRAIANADAEGFRVAYSNEAFELWYILHFEFLNTGVSRGDYLQKLNRLLGHDYLKNSDSIYEEIFDKQTTAIKNAEKLLKEYDPSDPAKDNPSTTVHLLVQELNRFIR